MGDMIDRDAAIGALEERRDKYLKDSQTWLQIQLDILAIRALPAAPAEDVRAGALKEAADVDWSTGQDVADTAPGYLTDWQRGFVAGQTAMRNAILALIPEAKP